MFGGFRGCLQLGSSDSREIPASRDGYIAVGFPAGLNRKRFSLIHTVLMCVCVCRAEYVHAYCVTMYCMDLLLGAKRRGAPSSCMY